MLQRYLLYLGFLDHIEKKEKKTSLLYNSLCGDENYKLLFTITYYTPSFVMKKWKTQININNKENKKQCVKKWKSKNIDWES